jgi:hypothetical protein
MALYPLKMDLRTLATISGAQANNPDHHEDPIVVMHYGEIFHVREIAYATPDNAEHLGLTPDQMYLVIN